MQQRHGIKGHLLSFRKSRGQTVWVKILGRIMSSLWEGKVKRRVRMGEPVFADLRTRGEVSEPDLPAINVPGWQACRDGQHVSFMRMEDWCLDGQRTVTEIKRHDDQPTGAL